MMGLPRRTFLQAGVCGLLGLNLPQLLRLQAAQNADDARQSKPLPTVSVIQVFLGGGLSHVDSFDPKPDAQAEVRGEFSSIATSIPGVRFSEHLPNLAGGADRFSLLRTVRHRHVVHDLGRRCMLSGQRQVVAGTPAIGAVVSKGVGWQVPPPYLAIPEMERNAGVLGAACDPYNVTRSRDYLKQARASIERTGKSAHPLRRRRMLQELNAEFDGVQGVSGEIDAYDESYRRALDILDSKSFQESTDLDNEPSAMRKRYGRTTIGDHLLLARRMIEAGSRFVTVALDGFDTHTGNFPQLKRLLPQLDQALSALLNDLEEREKLERTLAIVLSEFGRTPHINPSGGRDHWPHAMSVLWRGGRARGGQVIGETDATGSEPAGLAVAPEDLAFTLYSELGIDPATTYLPDGRRALNGGRLLTELF